MSHPDAGMTFWWIARSNWLVVHIGVVNGIVAIDSDGWIGTLRLGMTAWEREFSPRSTGSGAERATLLAGALFNREPNCSIRSDVNMSVESTARGQAVAGICQGASSPLSSQSVASIT